MIPTNVRQKSFALQRQAKKMEIQFRSDASSASKHVSFAKELDINCGVVEIVDPCDADANECKISQLCEKATLEVDGVKSWNDEAQEIA